MKHIWAAAFLFCAAPALADDAADMKAAAAAFYAHSTGLHADGIPDPTLLAKLKPVVSAALNDALNAASLAETRFMARNKNAPPLLEGDIFSSLFEGATRFSVTACQVSGAQGQCSVSLGYDDKSGKPTAWSDTLVLVKEGGVWRADDVRYGGKWAFANSGTLRDTLKLAAGLTR
jgi:hypothetical protein